MLSIILALSAALANDTPTDLNARIVAALIPAQCLDLKIDPLDGARAEIEKLQKEKKTEAALAKVINGWLAEERKSGKDRPELNWIRALNPWLLPKGFPARPAFSRCASELRTYSDARTAQKTDPAAIAAALGEWNDCLELIYPTEKPTAFTVILSCLTPHSTPSK